MGFLSCQQIGFKKIRGDIEVPYYTLNTEVLFVSNYGKGFETDLSFKIKKSRKAIKNLKFKFNDTKEGQ